MATTTSATSGPRLVIAITATMMVVEITAGSLFGSMALVADGWHMSTHAGAMLIAALAYSFARRNAPIRASASAPASLAIWPASPAPAILALIALLIGWESLVRLTNPVEISFPRQFRSR
ncbi:MAG: cation transporter [Geminicoccaceae bacterium]